MATQPIETGLIVQPAERPHAITPMEMLQIAVSQGADLDKLTKLMDLQERWERNEARKAFDAAMSAFKANPPELRKNKHVDFTGKTGIRTNYKHATLDEVAIQIGRALSPHGLSFRWNTDQANGKVKVTCILSHKAGHSETVQLEGSPDDTGNKNSIQQVGSTITYLQRYTLLAITGMAVQDQDNDGAAMLDDSMQDYIEIIRQAATMGELEAAYKEAFRVAVASKNKNAMGAVIEAKDKRRKEL